MNSEFYKTTLPTCKICFEEYDHFIHKPYIILPCAHSACIKCLETLMKTTKICPIDRGQIQNKKPNWELIDILDNAVPEPISSLRNENVLHTRCKLFEKEMLNLVQQTKLKIVEYTKKTVLDSKDLLDQERENLKDYEENLLKIMTNVKNPNEKSFLCKQCGSQLFLAKDIINKISSKASVTWTWDSLFHSKQTKLILPEATIVQLMGNQIAIDFKVITVASANFFLVAGSTSIDNTWFKNFTWTNASCLKCSSYIGWKFDSIIDKNYFFGVNINAIINEK